SPAEAQQVFSKLSSVCGQFLDWKVFAEPPVGDFVNVAETQAISCRMAHDKAQLAAASHWQGISELLAQSPKHEDSAAQKVSESKNSESTSNPPAPAPAMPADQNIEAEMSISAQSEPTMSSSQNGQKHLPIDEVIDLPQADGSVLDAVMKHAMNEVIECP